MSDKPVRPSDMSMSDQPTLPPQSRSGSFLPPSVERIKIPGYEVLGELGRGGMGVVYKARQTQLKRIVALKMILTGIHRDQEMVNRFNTEAQAVARFHHPNIVQIFEIGTLEGIPFFSLEYIEGGSLAEYLKGRSPSAREGAALIEQLARAVDDAHRKGIIHRDLKPANVLLSPKKKSPEEDLKGLKRPLAEYIPKITDFGLAKNLAAQSNTARGKLMGTPSYMAPEQAGGLAAGQVGAAADVYALGAILYELMTGRPPFLAGTPIDTVLLLTTTAPEPPRSLRPDLSRDLEAICLKCLAKTPRERYPSALALADDLQRYLEGGKVLAAPVGIQAKPKSVPESSKNAGAGGKGGMWLIAAVLLVAVTVIVFLSLR
jgi:eukaryotic-like serine/threonine-protein kinase